MASDIGTEAIVSVIGFTARGEGMIVRADWESHRNLPQMISDMPPNNLSVIHTLFKYLAALPILPRKLARTIKPS